MKYVFFGTPQFAAIILKKLIKTGFMPETVVCNPDKIVGRKKIITLPPTKIVAQKYNIAVFQPQKLEIGNWKLEIGEIDFAVVAAYSKILPKEILSIPRLGTLNVHPSLLPHWRGPTPIQYAILNGDQKTGVTIILLDEKIDHGPILAKSEIQISKSETYESLHNKLAELGANLLIEILPKFLRNEIRPLIQNETEATYSKILTKNDGEINWNKTSDEIDRQIRALNPEPGAFAYAKIKNQKSKIKNTNQNLKIFKILKAKAEEKPQNIICDKPSSIVWLNKKPVVCCEKGILVLETIQPEGKKPMNASDFFRGHLEIKKLNSASLL